MNTNRFFLEIWIGLVKVKSSSKIKQLIGSTERSFVNVIALAKNNIDYKKKVKKALVELNMEAIRFEDVETINERLQDYKIDRVIVAQANQMLKGGDRVWFSIFHSYND